MSPVIIDAVSGALGGAVGWLAARLVAPPGTKPERHRIVLIAFVVLGLQLSRTFVSPAITHWKEMRDFDAFLASDTLFSTVLADHPDLRGQLRKAVSEGLRSGRRDEAVAGSRAILMGVLPRYLARANGDSVIEFSRTLVGTLEVLRARDPEQCYQYLFPSKGGSVKLPEDQAKRLLEAIRTVVVNGSKQGDLPPNSGASDATRAIADVSSKLGPGLDALKEPQGPGSDHSKVCSATIDLYSGVLALPPEKAGPALRWMFAQ